MIKYNTVHVEGLTFQEFLSVNKAVLIQFKRSNKTPSLTKQLVRLLIVVIATFIIVTLLTRYVIDKSYVNNSMVFVVVLAWFIFIVLGRFNNYVALKDYYNQSYMMKNGFDLTFGADSYKSEYNDIYSICNYKAIDSRTKYNNIWILIIDRTFFWVREEDLAATGAPNEVKRLLQIS
ncbi:hypothetical protein N5853_06165 [Bartonella sp. HY329]|uniref:hypothetical protein n=1 Tax=unclassified Bartonella TaxID=2645622 RepID=UPI0021C7ACCE|nr:MULTISPECIES: hypothetical protein [unclassified Bartonella]UXM96192.1 hypothetical protein N5853_06165 [Bartonella sp. HY329]UXN10516.1 hypothetical protein N5852_06170 [Bartonella sp. HY328]